MKNDKTYRLLVSKMQEVALVPPQTLGPFTFIYRKVVPYFKYSPWISASILSALFSVFLYLALGSTLVRMVSILQFGF